MICLGTSYTTMQPRLWWPGLHYMRYTIECYFTTTLCALPSILTM